MLWIEKYRPTRCEEIAGQDEVVRHLVSFADTGNVPHLLVTGPHGTGKSVAIECLARRLYGGTWREDTSIFNAADLFSQGRGYLESDERFVHLYRKDRSLIANFKYIVRWHASMRPLGADFRLMVFEDAQALTFEAQQALRRIMERSCTTCRFVLSTTHPSAIIPAIASRCLPLFFAPVDNEIVRSCLEAILAEEAPDSDLPSPDDLALIAQAARGDLRKAILYLQLAVESGGAIGPSEVPGSETENITISAFDALRSGNYDAARRIVESLMIDYGLSAREVAHELGRVAERDYNDPRIAVEIARTDHLLCHHANDFVQISTLLARIAREVFGEEGSAAL